MKQILTLTFMLLLTVVGYALPTEYSADGGSGVVQFTLTGTTYNLSYPSWVSITPTVNGATLNVQYTVSANTDYHRRFGNLSLTAGGAFQTIQLSEAGKATGVSGASFSKDRIASNGFISIFGLDLANTTADGNLATNVGGTTVTIGQSLAKITYVSPTQVNAIIPNLPAGPVKITVESPLNKVTDTIVLQSIAPDIFALNQQGTDALAGTLQVNRDLSTSYFPLTTNGVVFGSPADAYFLLLYGSGIRKHDPTKEAYALIGGDKINLVYAGAQGQYEGLDQVAVPIPVSLAGRGTLNVQIFIDGAASNIVTLNFPPKLN